MFGMNFDLNDDVNAQVTFAKYNRPWADQAGAGVQSEENIDNITANVDIAEAYINLKGILNAEHKVGRQFHGTPGDIVIYYGPSGMNIVSYAVKAIDAWTGVWKYDKLEITGLMGKVFDKSASAMSDTDVYGLTASYDLGNEFLNPSAYVYQKDDRSVLANIARKGNVLGVKATGKFMGFNYKGEYAMNSGSDKVTTPGTSIEYNGNAIKLNADYDLDAGFGKFTFTGEFGRGTGDKTTTATKDEDFMAVNNNYAPGLLFSGVGVGATNTGLGNLTTYNVGAKLVPNKWDGKLNLCVKMFSFKYTEATADKIGTELDLTATWNHSEDVALRLALASFSPDQDFAGVGAKTDAKTLLGFDVNVKF